jgi:hypothetical protein
MKAFLDDRPLAIGRPTLSAAIEAALASARSTGRVVVEVRVDGQAVPDDVLEAPPDDATGDEVRIVSIQPAALVRATLLDAGHALRGAGEAQMACAHHLQSGRIDAGLKELSGVVDTWQAVREALDNGASLLGLPLDRLTAPDADVSLAAVIASLASRLEEIRRHLAAQDWSALADVLAYDMEGDAASWADLLDTVAQGLARGE